MLVSLSTLLRGTTYEKLRWTFTLYDLNGDGFITKQEVLNVMVAVHELMGMHGSPQVSLTRIAWINLVKMDANFLLPIIQFLRSQG